MDTLHFMVYFTLFIAVYGTHGGWPKNVFEGSDSKKSFHEAVLRSLSNLHRTLLRSASYTDGSEISPSGGVVISENQSPMSEGVVVPETPNTTPEDVVVSETQNTMQEESYNTTYEEYPSYSYCNGFHQCPSIDASTLIPPGSWQTGYTFTEDLLDRACRYSLELNDCLTVGNYSQCSYARVLVNSLRNVTDFTCYPPGKTGLIGALKCINNPEIQFDFYKNVLIAQGAFGVIDSWPNASENVTHMMTCRSINTFYDNVRRTLEQQCTESQIGPLLTFLRYHLSTMESYKRCFDERFGEM